MAFPGAKVHRVNRRKLGRGQAVAAVAVGCTVTGATTVITFTFSQPVVVSGQIPITVAGLTFVSQTIVSPTVVTQTWSATLATHAWTFNPGTTNVASYQGGAVLGSAGTF